MAYDTPVTVAAGETTSAAKFNKLVSSVLAIWKYGAIGDMDYYDSSSTKARIQIGTAGQALRVNSGATAPEWGDNKFAIIVTIGNGLDVITTGVQPFAVYIPQACTLQKVEIVSADNTSGSIVIDIWMDSYANFPPTDADSITASAPPTISSATKATDSTLTGWTKALPAGYWLRFNVDSATSLKVVSLALSGLKV